MTCQTCEDFGFTIDCEDEDCQARRWCRHGGNYLCLESAGIVDDMTEDPETEPDIQYI